MLVSVEMCDCINCHNALSEPIQFELCDEKSGSESQSKKGGTFAPPGAKGGSIISAAVGRTSHFSAFHRLADCTLEVLLGQVRVTHGHLQRAVTQQLGHQP